MAKAKIYHLASCNTCQKIIKGLATDDLDLQNIKVDKITETQMEEMYKLAGSYESLFSRRAMKYRAQGLHEIALDESDYRRLILEEYTFLKRPVAIVDDEIFIGNTKKVVAALTEKIKG